MEQEFNFLEKTGQDQEKMDQEIREKFQESKFLEKKEKRIKNLIFQEKRIKKKIFGIKIFRKKGKTDQEI